MLFFNTLSNAQPISINIVYKAIVKRDAEHPWLFEVVVMRFLNSDLAISHPNMQTILIITVR